MNDSLKLAEALGTIGNVVDGLLNKAGLFILLKLQEPVSVITSTNWVEVRNDLVDSVKRKSFEQKLSETFQPKNPVVDATLDRFLDLGEQTAAAIEKGVKDGHDAFESVQLILAQWKSFFGVAV